jgi:hypothetical protein
MELVISVVIGILIVEAYAWLPKLSEKIIEWVVQGLRSEDQDRGREEMTADLNALPNTVVKLIHALSYLGAAQKMNADFFDSKLAAIDALIEECDHKHSRMVVAFHAAKERLGISQTDFRQKLAQLSALKARVDGIEVTCSLQNAVTAISSLQNAVTAINGLAGTYAIGIGRSADLMAVCVDRVTERLNHVKGLILRALHKRDQVAELLGRRDVSPDTLDTLLADLAGDLDTVKNIFEDDNWGDDDSLREAERITVVMHESARSLGRAVPINQIHQPPRRAGTI